MYIYDMPLNYLGVIIAAIVYLILGSIWYLPSLFGKHCVKTEEVPQKECTLSHTIGIFAGEFVLDLVMAFVLAIFIQISQAENYVEAMIIAFWAWIGFVATTHFSAVLWGHKPLKNFFIHAGFMLIGLLAMSLVIYYFI